MLCSVELPIKYLPYSILFDFDFVIASTCVSHPEYLTYFLHAPRRFMILDNGAFETGEAMNDQDYIALARKLQPNILVIPDVYKDNAATGMRAINFLNTWEEGPIGGVELMGVLQGDHPRMLDSMIKIIYKDLKWLALPYATGLDRFQFLKARPHIQNVHILGLPTAIEAIALRELPCVRSVDSSIPVKCTVEHKYIDIEHSANKYAHPATEDLDELLLQYNLQAFTSMCTNGLNRGQYASS